MQRFTPAGIFMHKEAFCLMKYASIDGQIVEWIWNSRDGVTPYGIMDRTGEVELFHVQWNMDVLIIGYRPLPGERVFVSVDEHSLTNSINRQIEAWWDEGEFPMRLRYPNRTTAFLEIKDARKEEIGRAPRVVAAEEYYQLIGHSPPVGRSWL